MAGTELDLGRATGFTPVVCCSPENHGDEPRGSQGWNQIGSTPVLSPKDFAGAPIRSNIARNRFIRGVSLFFG